MERLPRPLEPLTATQYSDRIRSRFGAVIRMDYGMSIYRGWGPIVEHAIERAVAICGLYGAEIVISEVKQKLGELRIHWHLRTEPVVYVRNARFGDADGMLAANGWSLREALSDGEPVYVRDAGGGYVEALEPGLRALAVNSLVTGEFDLAARRAAVTCEFCGMGGGELDTTRGYIAVACEEHRGDGQPPMRGDELVAT